MSAKTTLSEKDEFICWGEEERINIQTHRSTKFGYEKEKIEFESQFS